MILSNKRVFPIVICSLILLGLTFRLWASHLDWMHYDENYYINITQNFLARGELTPCLWRLGDLHIISGGGSGYGILGLIYWLRAVDYSLFWGRVLMVVINLLTAGVMCFVASRWWSSRAAGLAIFCYGIVATSSFNTMIVKMDAFGILLYSFVLLLYVYIYGKDRFWLHFLAGVVGVVTLEFHILGVLYIIAIGLCYLYDLVLERVRNHRITINQKILGFGTGILAGLVYLVIHVLPNPKAYFVISQNCFECNENITITEFKRWIRMLVFRPHKLLIILGVILFAIKRKLEVDRRYLVLISGWLAAQAIIRPPPYDHYFNHFWPIVAIGVGGAVAYGYNFRPKQRWLAANLIAGFVLLFTNMGMYLSGNYLSMLGYPLAVTPQIQYIQNNITKNEVIMGNIPTFYYL